MKRFLIVAFLLMSAVVLWPATTNAVDEPTCTLSHTFTVLPNQVNVKLDWMNGAVDSHHTVDFNDNSSTKEPFGKEGVSNLPHAYAYNPTPGATTTYVVKATIVPDTDVTCQDTITISIPGTPTATKTFTRTPTNTLTSTFTATATKTVTATKTLTPTLTPTFTKTATSTHTATLTATPTLTVTETPTMTPTEIPVTCTLDVSDDPGIYNRRNFKLTNTSETGGVESFKVVFGDDHNFTQDLGPGQSVEFFHDFPWYSGKYTVRVKANNKNVCSAKVVITHPNDPKPTSTPTIVPTRTPLKCQVSLSFSDETDTITITVTYEGGKSKVPQWKRQKPQGGWTKWKKESSWEAPEGTEGQASYELPVTKGGKYKVRAKVKNGARSKFCYQKITITDPS